MKRHWQVRRALQPAEDAAQRWDRAYMLILGMSPCDSRAARVSATSLPTQKGSHEDGGLRAGLDLAPSPDPNH